MIRRSLVMLMVLAFALSVATVALARGAPTKQKAGTSNAAVEMASPSVAPVPAMIGYDVIQNLSESRDLSIARDTFDVATMAYVRQSSTVDWQSHDSDRSGRARSSPLIMLKR